MELEKQTIHVRNIDSILASLRNEARSSEFVRDIVDLVTFDEAQKLSHKAATLVPDLEADVTRCERVLKKARDGASKADDAKEKAKAALDVEKAQRPLGGKEVFHLELAHTDAKRASRQAATDVNIASGQLLTAQKRLASAERILAALRQVQKPDSDELEAAFHTMAGR